MRHRIASAAIVVAVAVLASAASAQVQRSFGGETVNLELSAGTYWVTASYDGRIRILPRTKADQASVRLNVNTLGRRADVTVTGPKDGFEADIELPRHVQMIVTLAGGTLRVRGIDGSKNISAKTGEIDIEIGDRNRYGRVIASVRTGAVNPPGFHTGQPDRRSFEWTGSGIHDLNVRLDSGTITLRE